MITREDIRRNRSTHIYVFGDNLERRGLGGQAAVARGEPNAFGVPTKREPSMSPTAFFSDDAYTENCNAILHAVNHIPDDGRVIVIMPGIGTGLSQLPQRAPRTYAFLVEALATLMEGEK